MKKILIINPFGIGDVLFTTPVIKALKHFYPDSFIAYLCNRRVEPVLKHNAYVDKLFFFTRGDFKEIKQESTYKFIKYFWKAIRQLIQMKIDMVIDLSTVNQYSLVLWLIGVNKRLGFDYKNRGYFLTDKIKIDGFWDKHILEYYQDLLDKLDIKLFEKKLEFKLNKKDEEWADNFIEKHNLNNGQRVVGISAFGGASWGNNAKNKQWPLERFANIAKEIIRKYKAKIILFGAEKDKNDSKILEGLIKCEQIINVTGQTNLGQLAALMRHLHLFIGNDSGPLHIACAAGVKTISIFGPVNEKVYGPVGEKSFHAVISKQLPCRPCYKDFKVKKCAHMDCLLQICENDVIKEIERLL